MRDFVAVCAIAVRDNSSAKCQKDQELELSGAVFVLRPAVARRSTERLLYQTAPALPKERIWGIIRARFFATTTTTMRWRLVCCVRTMKRCLHKFIEHRRCKLAR